MEATVSSQLFEIAVTAEPLAFAWDEPGTPPVYAVGPSFYLTRHHMNRPSSLWHLIDDLFTENLAAGWISLPAETPPETAIILARAWLAGFAAGDRHGAAEGYKRGYLDLAGDLRAAVSKFKKGLKS
ncbi:MAG: hypothetical protein WCJ64_00520 [Rhodospirillaceae bacterium]